jgi:hypothetical protein
MLKLQLLEVPAQTPASGAGEGGAVHPEDRVYSGMFGDGRVVELLKNEHGYAYGQRIVFDNGMEAQLLITGLPTRH